MLQDDNSGRQRWVFTAIAGGFTITVAGGRAGCSTLFTAGTTCGNDNSVTFAAAVSVLAAEASWAEATAAEVVRSLTLMQAQPDVVWNILVLVCRPLRSQLGR